MRLLVTGAAGMISKPAERGAAAGAAPTLVDMIETMTARSKSGRPSIMQTIMGV